MINKNLLGILILSINLFANNIKIENNVQIGTEIIMIDGEMDTMNSVGYGLGINYNNILLGLDINAGYSNFNKNDMLEYSIETEIGYSFIDNLNLYFIAGYKIVDSVGFDSNGYGFGAAVEYKFENQVAIELRYSIYDMYFENLNNLSYQDDKAKFSIKYYF